MNILLGFILIVLGIILGLYVGGWVLFIGGMVQIIEGIKANPINALNLATGIFKFIISGVVGWLTFGILCAVGGVLIKNN